VWGRQLGDALRAHAGRGDLSRWVDDVVGDPELAGRLAVIERAADDVSSTLLLARPSHELRRSRTVSRKLKSR
jgi:hypothetical protein